MKQKIKYVKQVMQSCTLVSLAIFSMFSPSTLADMGQSTVKFHGSLVVVDCSVNNNTDTPVDFGDQVRSDLIDGVKYDVQPIPVKITCDGPQTGDIQVQLTGEAGSENTSIRTSLDGLDIRILKDNTPQQIGTWNTVKDSEDIQLYAVLVKEDADAKLSGDFSATATLVVRML